MILSQKFSQLSTKGDDDDEQKLIVTNKRRRSSAVPSSPSVSLKKTKTNDDHPDDMDDSITTTEPYQIPTYLLTTNRFFIHLAENVTNTMSLNDLQQVAVLIHQKYALDLDRQIMKAYFHSVKGTLKETECDLVKVDRRVWPAQVKSLVLAQQKSTNTTTMTSDTTATMDTVTEYEQIVCENLLHQRIREMQQQIQQYQKQLGEKKNSLIGFTSAMEKIISNYVQEHGIKPIEMKRDLKIALINYDYDSEILQRKYLQAKPHEYQVKQKNIFF